MEAISSNEQALVDATSGSLGSLLTATLLYPLDVAKTRVQSGRAAQTSASAVLFHLLRTEPAALLRGIGPKAVHTVLQSFLYFYSYSALKSAWKAAGLRVNTAGNTLCGVVAGIAGLTLTLPLETLVVRVQCAGADGDVLTECSRLVAEGVGGLWRGFSVSSILCLNPAITNAVFDTLKAMLLKGRRGADKRITTAEAFLLGSASKCLATWLTYPLIRTKTVMQSQDKGKAKKSDDAPAASAHQPTDSTACTAVPSSGLPNFRFAEVLVSIAREQGVAGLFRGFGAQIFTAVVKSGIQLTCKEAMWRYALALVLFFSGRNRAKKIAHA